MKPKRKVNWPALVYVVLLFCANVVFADVPLPAINTNNIILATNYGNNVTNIDNASYIQNAINQAAKGGKTNNLFGGTLEIPAGIYLCGPLILTNNVNLQLDAGAVLRMLPFGQYPMTYFTNYSTNFVGSLTNVATNITWMAANFIYGNDLTNIEVSGSGAVDGQGSPWWPYAYTNGDTRPNMISLPGCNRILIQNVTLSNSPMVHIAASHSANATVQFVTVLAPSSTDPSNPSHNTAGCTIYGSNLVMQANYMSEGDDNYACSSAVNVVITNNFFGFGHGTSVGSYTSPYVTNFLIINNTYSNTEAAAHIKSDRDRGGLVDNINFYNLTLTNVMHPIQIYCQYTNKSIPSLDSITPGVAAAYPAAPVTSTTPMYRNIIISNFTGNATNIQASGPRAAGLIWGLPECSISNIMLINVHLSGSITFGIYDAKNIQIIDSTHSVPAGVSQYSFYDASVTFSNSIPPANVVTLDGVTSNSVPNNFTFYNSLMTLSSTNAIALNSSVTLGASTFTISNNFAMTPSNSFNFILGINAATVVVKGNLALGGTNNIYAGKGFTNGTYTLMTYTGTLNGRLPILGITPSGYVCALNTNTVGLVKLMVTPPPPGIPTNFTAFGTNVLINLNWDASSNTAGYILQRSTTNGGPYGIVANQAATNFSDGAVDPGTAYYYIIIATNSAGISGNSIQASAVPLPSLVSTNLNVSVLGNQMQLSWPTDHTGWRLETQTNNLGTGLNSNWFTINGSTLTNQISVPVNLINECVFFRLTY